MLLKAELIWGNFAMLCLTMLSDGRHMDLRLSQILPAFLLLRETPGLHLFFNPHSLTFNTSSAQAATSYERAMKNHCEIQARASLSSLCKAWLVICLLSSALTSLYSDISIPKYGVKLWHGNDWAVCLHIWSIADITMTTQLWHQLCPYMEMWCCLHM